MTSKPKVATASCGNYQPNDVQNAIDSVLDQLGGLDKFVFANAKVFVKVNLVRDMAPEKCGTTHPQVVIALCKRLQQLTPNVVVGDSCGGLYTKSVMNGVYAKCKMTDVAEQTCATLNDDFGSSEVNFGGVLGQKCQVLDAFKKADVVINVTKLKTHSFAGYTGAVKNLYGLIPGLVKVEMHSRYPDLGDFCNLLCDVEQYASSKITLHVADAVVGMEGEGPTNGKPKFLGQIIASANPYALDVVAVSLFCKDVFSMPLLQVAQKRGLVSDNLKDVDFNFDSWQNNFVQNFDVPPVTDTDTFLHMPKWVKKLAKKHLTKRVKIKVKTCRGCGKCVAHCPAKAIVVQNKVAKVNQSKCIRCYCCQELCPFDSVKFNRPLLYKVVHAFSGTKNKGK